MSDRFPAEIWIGGTVNRETLQGLLTALNQDGACLDFGDAPISNKVFVKQWSGETDEAHIEKLWDRVALYLDDESLLNLKDDQAHSGEFDRTEAFCIQHDIPFDRWSDHYCEYDAENVHFRPGMNTPVHTFADSRGNEIVCGDTVRQAIECFEACKTPVPHTMKTGKFKEGLKLLYDACPDKADKTPLTKFEIVP